MKFSKVILIVSLGLFIFNSTIYGQEKKYADFIDPDEILIGEQTPPKVLLIGTFHFRYPNLDAHKTAETDQINILSEQKQTEVKELLDYIAAFQPTKIVVEAGRNTGYLMHRYNEWQSGDRKLGVGEVEQIGFRLMQRFDLDTIYGCDANSLRHRMNNTKDTAVFRPFLRDLYKNFSWNSDDPLDAKYDELYDYEDRLCARTNLLEYFKYMNDEKVVRRSHGAYLIGDFRNEDEKGVDVTALYWYSRNLRIFRKIQAIKTTSEDRVLVLFGAGHLPILKHLFESTPEFEVVPFDSLNKITTKK